MSGIVMNTRKAIPVAVLVGVLGITLANVVDAAVINVPSDRPTIQDAIDAAVSLVDEVVVAPSTYTEIIGFGGKVITVRSSGGGMTIHNSSSPTVTNCTFSGNSAGFNGGGMFNLNSSQTVTNCILWGDSPDEIFIFSGAPVVTFCDVQGDNDVDLDDDALFITVVEPNKLVHREPPLQVGHGAFKQPRILPAAQRAGFIVSVVLSWRF